MQAAVTAASEIANSATVAWKPSGGDNAITAAFSRRSSSGDGMDAGLQVGEGRGMEIGEGGEGKKRRRGES